MVVVCRLCLAYVLDTIPCRSFEFVSDMPGTAVEVDIAGSTGSPSSVCVAGLCFCCSAVRSMRARSSLSRRTACVTPCVRILVSDLHWQGLVGPWKHKRK